MNELVVVTLDEAGTAIAARRVLEDVHGIHAAVLDADALEKEPAGRARRWLGLPWRATSALAVSSLTAIAWTSLIVGAISGEVAGWLMDRLDRNILPKEVVRSLQQEKVNLVLYSDAALPDEALKYVQELGGHIWRASLQARDAERLRAALGTGHDMTSTNHT